MLFRSITDLGLTLDELKQGMSKFVAFAYEEKQVDVDSLPRPHDLYPFLVMLDWITAESKGYNKQFCEPLMGCAFLFPWRASCTTDVPCIKVHRRSRHFHRRRSSRIRQAPRRFKNSFARRGVADRERCQRRRLVGSLSRRHRAPEDAQRVLSRVRLYRFARLTFA